MKVLSVTVPSYNAEKFLKKGINTMLDERILNVVEIIIVDDGSTDRTAEIADKFHEQYPNTVKVVHKENGGHGSGVNSGIQAATGKYFCVIDADDWVDTENFVKIVRYMKKSKSDLILTDGLEVDENDKILSKNKVKCLPKRREVYIDGYLNKKKFFPMLGGYFILSDILKKNHICCHEHCYYVDNEFVDYSLIYVRTVAYLDITVTHHWLGRGGQSVSLEGHRKYYQDQINVTNYLIDFYKRNHEIMSKNQRMYFIRKTAWFLRGIYSTSLSYNNRKWKEEMIRYDKKLKAQSLEVYRANRNLCIWLLRLSNFKCYKLASLIYLTVTQHLQLYNWIITKR